VQLSLLFVTLCAASLLFVSAATPANAPPLRLAVYIFGAIALVAALGAVGFRLTETPREVILRIRRDTGSSVIHIKGND
jgi:hypothetical protein